MGNLSPAVNQQGQMQPRQAGHIRGLAHHQGGPVMDPRYASMEPGMGNMPFAMDQQGQRPSLHSGPVMNPRLRSIESGMGNPSLAVNQQGQRPSLHSGPVMDPPYVSIESGMGNNAMSPREQMPFQQASPSRSLPPHQKGQVLNPHAAPFVSKIGKSSFAISPREQRSSHLAGPSHPLPPIHTGQVMGPRPAAFESQIGGPSFAVSLREQMPYQQAGHSHSLPPPHRGQARAPRVASFEPSMGHLSVAMNPQEETPMQVAQPEPPSPSSPPRPYIRPAVAEDADEICRIINWHNSSQWDLEPEIVEPQRVVDYIKTCQNRHLPFVVLVIPPDLSRPSQESPGLQLGGLTYIDSWQDRVVEEDPGDLRVYVCPKWTRHGFGTALVDCILAICDVHYNRTVQFDWRSIPDVDISHTVRLEWLMCGIAYPAQLRGRFAFIWHWLENRFGFRFLNESTQRRARHGHENNFYRVWLPLNAGRRWQRRRAELPEMIVQYQRRMARLIQSQD